MPELNAKIMSRALVCQHLDPRVDQRKQDWARGELIRHLPSSRANIVIGFLFLPTTSHNIPIHSLFLVQIQKSQLQPHQHFENSGRLNPANQTSHSRNHDGLVEEEVQRVLHLLHALDRRQSPRLLGREQDLLHS